MVGSLVAALAVSFSPQQVDTATFSDPATAELYARARVRHVRQDSLVQDYRAMVTTRLDATVGRSRFARQTALLVHETRAAVTWRRPNDLRVRVLGARSAAPIVRLVPGLKGESSRDVQEEVRREFRQGVWLDRPWFIPRSLGDSIRLLELPERAALHPLARGGTRYYRFAIVDSVRLSTPGRDVRAFKVRVEPRQLAPSLVAGDMWIDRETADVVRLVVVFLGEYLWESPDGEAPGDSVRARKENERANRYLSVEADIEYALVENRYWLPYRQLLNLTAEVPWFVNAVLPARAVSRFTDYEVNTVPDVTFAVVLPRDSADPGRERSRVRVKNVAADDDRDSRYRSGYYRAGRWSNGRWEVDIPPADSLAGFQWAEPFRVSLDAEEEERLRESVADLAGIAERLPAQWVGRSTYGLAWEAVSDVIRFNRVQGLSVGVGYQVRPGLAFTTVLVSGRFGFGDLRPTGSVTWRRDAPAGRFDLSAFRLVREAEPWSSGLGLGNSLNALLAGHDDADYYLSLGSGFSYRWNAGLLRDMRFSASLERQTSMVTEVDAPVPDLFGSGLFQRNPPIVEGTFVSAGVVRDGVMGAVQHRQGAELLAGAGQLAGRVWGDIAVPFRLLGRTGTASLRVGVTRGDSLPQLAFRLGGPATVRGHTYGRRVGREFWAAQLDVALTRSPWLAPVVFMDVADTFSSDPLVGAGVGMSLLSGLARFALSKGLRPSEDVRFDLVFRAPR